MLVKLGDRLTTLFRATAPDPFVLAVFLTLATFFLAWGIVGAEPARLLDAWATGLWQPKLLAFAFQMCLVLVTGHALASTPAVSRLLGALAGVPRTGRQAVALTAFVSILAGLVNWGLGLVVGSVLARDVGRSMRARNVPTPYPLLAAAGYMSLLCWHGGLSGSAPLQCAKPGELAALVGPELAAQIGELPVTRTLLTPLNLVVTGGLLVILPVFLALLCPRADRARERPIIGDVCACPLPDPPRWLRPPRAVTLPEWLDRSPIVLWLIALPALWWLARHFLAHGAAGLTLDTAIMGFLAAGLLLHGSATRYMDAATDAAAGCSGIVVQFPLYFGVMAMISLAPAGGGSSLAVEMSEWFVRAAGGSEGALALMTFAGACLLGLFIPSGGGQWAVQGPVTLLAAVQTGADPGRLVMAVAYGDQWANMLQPFWALPLLAITGVKAREIVAYTVLAAVVAGVWMGLWLWLL